MQYEIFIREEPTGTKTLNATNGHVYDYFRTPEKSNKLNAIEQYHIYRLTKSGKPINEQHTEKHNPIF
jgi:hypothetical protein